MARMPAIAFFLLAIGWVGAQDAGVQKAPPGVAALVNDKPLYETAVQRGLDRVPPEKKAQARKELVSHLVENMLVDQYLQQQKVAVEPGEVDKRLGQMREEVIKQGKEFTKMLEELKLSEAELKEHITAEVRWEKFVDSQANDKVLKETFQQNKEVFDGSSVRARHILLNMNAAEAGGEEKVRGQIASLKKTIDDEVNGGLAKLLPGTDSLIKEKTRTALVDEAFANVARKKSECPSKDQGGDVGWFGRDGDMVENFSKTAFTQSVYQVSEPVKTQFGFHLILTTERKLGKEVKFEEVQGEVKEYFAEKLKERLAEHVKKFSRVQIFPAPAGL
ncbi:MAG: hypothetical protein EXR99_08295 [Gemmataceae bacterium]|nr:hypothetical protein [Gemmataceae bacterium]